MADRLRRERRRFIQALLRASLTLSAALMTVGLVIWSSSNQATARAVTLDRLFSTLDTGNRLMLAGIALLAITPALRVLALLVLWVRERAWRFAATSTIWVANRFWSSLATCMSIIHAPSLWKLEASHIAGSPSCRFTEGHSGARSARTPTPCRSHCYR